MMTWIDESRQYKEKLKNKYRLLEKIDVDGFKVDNSHYFSPTFKYIEERYKEFNKKYFKNALDSFSSYFKLHIVEENRRDGLTLIYTFTDGSSRPFYLGISRYYQNTEKFYCEVLLHEMIHVYQSNVLHMNKLSHDNSFLNKMEEINKYGWNIILESKRSYSNVLFPSVNQSILKGILVVVRSKNDDLGLFIINKTELEKTMKLFKNARFFKIKNTEKFKLYDKITDIENVIFGWDSQGITLIKKSEQELEKMITDFDIEEIPNKGLSEKRYKITGIKFLENTKQNIWEEEGYDEYGLYYCVSKPLIIDGKECRIVGAE